MQRRSTFRYFGKVLPPGRDVSDFELKSFEFSREDAREIDRRGLLRGLPLKWNHRLAIGRVVDSVLGDDGWTYAWVDIDTSLPRGELVAREIEAGNRQGLSLTGDFRAWISPGRVEERRRLVELSNVAEPLRPGCEILSFHRAGESDKRAPRDIISAAAAAGKRKSMTDSTTADADAEGLKKHLRELVAINEKVTKHNEELAGQLDETKKQLVPLQGAAVELEAQRKRAFDEDRAKLLELLAPVDTAELDAQLKTVAPSGVEKDEKADLVHTITACFAKYRDTVDATADEVQTRKRKALDATAKNDSLGRAIQDLEAKYRATKRRFADAEPPNAGPLELTEKERLAVEAARRMS